MNDENEKRIIGRWLRDLTPDFERKENPYCKAIASRLGIEKKANAYWEDVYEGPRHFWCGVIPSREEIGKDVKIRSNVMLFKDSVELAATYGPDRHGYCAEEHECIDYDRYYDDPGFVGLIEEKLTQNVADRVVHMYEADRIRAAMTAEDSIKKYNVMPAIKKEENKMPITGKRMIATVGGGVDIADIQVYNNKVVKVVFSDGTFTKSVCGENDTFDLDIGITICVIKRMAGRDGHRWYNNMIRKAHDIMDRNAEEKQKYQEYKQKVKEHNKREQEKRKAGKEKAKQEQIDIHSEAFLNALKTWKELEKKHHGAVGD